MEEHYMTTDDIIRIYSQVSDELCNGTEWCWAGVGEPLQRFAELVAAAEREACAKVAEKRLIDKANCTAEQMYEMLKTSIAEDIRARGNHG